jgi:predicted regulator of Ras-like GTPase activity (Roadblock/LC7/MglB family)
MSAYFNPYEHPRSIAGKFIDRIYLKDRVNIDAGLAQSTSREDLQRLLPDGGVVKARTLYVSGSGRQRILAFYADVDGQEQNISAEIASTLGEQVVVKSESQGVLFNNIGPSAGIIVIHELSESLGRILKYSELDQDGSPIQKTSAHGRNLPFL